MHLLIGTVGFIVAGMLCYGFYTGYRMGARYAPLEDAAMEVKLEITTSHLWLEEILSGDRHENMQKVWEHIDSAEWYAQAMLKGGKNEEGIFLPLEDPTMRRHVRDMLVKLSEYRDITKQRLAAEEASGAGTSLDQSYDAAFAVLIQQADKVETRLQRVMGQDLHNFRFIQILLIICCGLLFLAVGIIFHRFDRRRTKDYQSLKKTKEALEKENVERRQAERALRKYKHIVSTASDHMAFIDSNYIYQAVNDAYLKAHSKTHDEIEGHSIPELLGPVIFKEKVKDYFDQCLKGREIRYQSWFTFPEMDQRYMDVAYYPFFEADHTVSGVVVSSRDITAQKQMEKQLLKSKLMLQAVFDGISEPLIMFDKSMIVKMLNRAAAEYFNVEFQGAVGKICHEAFNICTDPCEVCIIPANITKERPMIIERNGVMKPERFEQMAVYPVLDNGEETGSIIVRISDITEAKLMEKELAQSQKLAAVGELAAGVAHEINNPINGVINYAQILIDDAGKGVDENGIPARIMREAERIAVIVKNLLAFAQQSDDPPSSMAVKDIVVDTMQLIANQLNNDDIMLKLDIPDDLPMVNVNNRKIQQVLMNLLINARYALNEKYPGFDTNKVIRLEGEIKEIAGKRYSRITIHDNGIGIPEDIIDRIYDPFFSTKPKSQGAGLGLSISYGIVKDHRGHLSFESTEGEYTKAMVDLPIIQ